MEIGIRAHDLGKDSITGLLDKAVQYEFKNLQLVFKKGFVDNENNPILFNEENAKVVAEELKKRNLQVAMLGAYFNPVHSNKDLVKKNTEYFIEHLKFASLLDCKYVGTETGSYNDDKWTYNPKNQTEEGYQDTMNTFRHLKDEAEKYHTTLLMEPAWGHVIYSVEQLERAVKELNSQYVKVTIDIFNLIYIGNYQNYKEIFTKALSTFKDDVKIIHLKDFYVENDKIIQCGLGKGIIDFDFILSIVYKYAPNAKLIFEGVTGEDIIPSRNLINKILNTYKK